MCSCHILLLPIRYVHNTSGAFDCAGNKLTLFTLGAQMAKTVMFVLTLCTVYRQTFRHIFISTVTFYYNMYFYLFMCQHSIILSCFHFVTLYTDFCDHFCGDSPRFCGHHHKEFQPTNIKVPKHVMEQVFLWSVENIY